MAKLEVIQLTVGHLASNCLLVYHPESLECIIIDPGDDVNYIIRTISDHKLKPTGIFATHGHFDHIMAVNELKLAYNLPFCIHPEDEFLVKNLKQNAQYFLPIDPGPPPQIDKFIPVQKKFDLGIDTFETIHTPGHTPGSVSFYHQASRFVIVGDVIFAGGGIGRYDFSYCSYDDLKQSVKKLFKLPLESIVYSGHGPPTTIGSEKVNLTQL